MAGVKFSELLSGRVIGWCAEDAGGCCSSSFFSNIDALSKTDPQLFVSTGESAASDVNFTLLSITGWFVGVVDVDKSSLFVSSVSVAATACMISDELVKGFCGVCAPSGELIGFVADESGDTRDEVDESAGELGWTDVVVMIVLLELLLPLLVDL